ncbi:MAG: tetratricopeptide repeat protein [Planctomycetia bacterium]|nr:tetratricopeptide repeat protein [Planctomycetia bacterium]
MVRSFVRFIGFGGVAVAVVALAASLLPADPLSIDSLQKPEPAAQQQQQIPEIAEAVTLFRNRDVAGAYAKLQAAVKNRPELPPAELIMVQFFVSARQEDAVRGWLEKAVVAAPNDPEAYVLLGQEAMQNQRMAEATLLFDKAKTLLASFKGNDKRKADLAAATESQLARLAMGRQDWATAQTHLQDLLKLQPDSAAALQMLGRTLFEQKKPEEALEKLKAAKVADPKVLTPEAVLAQWYEQVTPPDRENATKYMIAALTAQPKDFRTRLNAADWAFKAGEFDQARAQIDIALTLDANSPEAKLLAGNIAIYQKDYPTAEKCFKQVLVESPSNFAASNNLALALCEQDDKAKQELALQYAKMNAQLYQKEVEPLSTLGRVFFRLGRMAEADQVFRQVAASGKSLSPDTAFYIADLYAATNRADDAKKLLENALKTTGPLFSLRKEAEALQKRLP